MQNAFFDNYALTYDKDFSYSPVGKAQREIVHGYLNSIDTTGKTVLEINCGTGVDAAFLSKKYRQVFCTDISPEMVKMTVVKTASFGNCCASVSSIQDLDKNVSQKADHVFSNFGGLNCLNKTELEKFSADCIGLTSDDSELVFVIMGRKCLWERLYFAFKGDSQKAMRRKDPGGVQVKSIKESFPVYYYSPDEITSLFNGFHVARIRPVGLFIPPSYLNSFFEKRPFLFRLLKKMDHVFGRISFLSDYGDHYLIHLKSK